MVQRALVVLVSVAALFSGIPAVAAARSIYVALGDSVAAPSGSYADRYFAYLRDPAHGGVQRLVKLARGGETSTGMLVPGGQLERAIDVIGRASNTAVVTLDIGGNDALQRSECLAGFNSDVCPFRASFTKIVNALAEALAADPGPETFRVMEYYNPQTGAGPPLEPLYDAGLLGTDGRIDCERSGSDLGLNDLIACIGTDAGAEPVDVYSTAKAAGPSFVDGIHPTRAGDAAIACLFAHPDRGGIAAPCRVLSLSGRRRQQALVDRAVIVSVRTDRQAAVTVAARVKRPGPDIRLTAVTLSVPAAHRVAVTLPLSAAAQRALRTRRHLGAVVKVRALDEAGRIHRESRTYELVAPLSRLKQFKANRDQELAHRCSVGEVCGALRDVFGEYQAEI